MGPKPRRQPPRKAKMNPRFRGSPSPELYDDEWPLLKPTSSTSKVKDSSSDDMGLSEDSGEQSKDATHANRQVKGLEVSNESVRSEKMSPQELDLSPELASSAIESPEENACPMMSARVQEHAAAENVNDVHEKVISLNPNEASSKPLDHGILGEVPSNLTGDVDGTNFVLSHNPKGQDGIGPVLIKPVPIGVRSPKEIHPAGPDKVGLNILNSPSIGLKTTAGLEPSIEQTDSDPFCLEETIQASVTSSRMHGPAVEAHIADATVGPGTQFDDPASSIGPVNDVLGNDAAYGSVSHGNGSGFATGQQVSIDAAMLDSHNSVNQKDDEPNQRPAIILTNDGEHDTSSKFPTFGTFNPLNLKSFTFKCSNDLILEDGADFDPIRGSKYWNKELFTQLVSGVDVNDSETRLCYKPPKKDENGEVVIDLNGHFMTKSVKAYRLQLYGYFIGGNLSFQEVRENLIKMWYKFGIKFISKKPGGLYFFTFENDDGLLQVLERNPWVVKDVPLVLQLWEPDKVLSKPNLSNVPMWVTIKDLPLCLWNGGNIGQVVSCLGRPLMLDKPTYDRCNEKKGPFSYARVLVDVNASNDMVSRVKVRFPDRNGVPGQVSFLELGYKWKPIKCSTCEVFGHYECGKKPVSDPPPTQPMTRPVKPMEGPSVTAQVATDLKAQQAPLDGFVKVLSKSTKKRFNRKNKATGLGDDGLKKLEREKVQSVGIGPVKTGGPTKVDVDTGPGTCKEGVGPVKINQVGDAVASNQPKATGPDPSTRVGPGKTSNFSARQTWAPVRKPNSGSSGTGVFISSGMENSQNKALKGKEKIALSNKYATLTDEDGDFYDGSLGLWDSQIRKVKAYYDSNTRPPDEEVREWDVTLRKYFENLLHSREHVGSSGTQKEQTSNVKIVELVDDEDSEVASDEDGQDMRL